MRNSVVRIAASCLLWVAIGYHYSPAFLAAAEKPISPQTPVEEQVSFGLADDSLVIELVASEPDVVSPVAIAWDEDGRMLVAEMADYPTSSTGGRIKILEDLDDNGKYRSAKVYADGLPFPNGVLPYKGGVFVTAAPDIWYIKNRGASGVERRVVLTGFREGNQQLRVNGLIWGLDNWIYGANGRSNGELRRPSDPTDKAISISRHDFRFRPDTGEVEAVAGFSQFGLARDDFGRRFLSWNTIPFRHVVLEEHYLNRNPYLASAASVAIISDPADQGRLFPLSPTPTTFNREPVQFFNASCGNAIYRGDLLDPKYRGNAFVCEPLTNLVHRRVLTPARVTFTAQRADHGKEFLASADPWFHPVNLATGPDGALYVVDFYRQWVEHPRYVSESLGKDVDWRSGWNHGRIWRIRPKNAAQRSIPQLSQLASAELVRHLGHANGWRRDTAQRLLFERQDRQVVPFLKEAFLRSTSSLFAVHALWTLQELNSLDEEILLHALRADDPNVREHAIRLAESRLASDELKRAVLEQVGHNSLAVRFQAALTLGQLDGQEALNALAQIAQLDAGDEWSRLAVLCGLKENAWPFLKLWLQKQLEWPQVVPEERIQLLVQIAAVIGAQNKNADLAECLESLSQSPTPMLVRLAMLAGLAEGMAHTARPLGTLLAKTPPEFEKPIRSLNDLFQSAREVAASTNEHARLRTLAIKVLTQARYGDVRELILDLLLPEQPPAVQSAAARGLGDVFESQLGSRVLDRWATYTIGTRRDIVAAFLRSADSAAELVEALEQEKLAVSDLEPAARDLLQRIPRFNMKSRVQSLLGKVLSADRAAVIGQYQPSLGLAADAERGADLFLKQCVACHRWQGKGHRVGPDLSGVAGRPAETLLDDILNPSKEVSPDFINYMMVTTQGQFLSGLVTAETATAVKLRRAEGLEDLVLRSEIAELRASGKSLMPEGLEKSLNIQDMADLLKFLQQSTVPNR